MAPPRNTRRRNALADAAIEVLGTGGIHKLSHRAVDERAGLPAGTAANYFPRRDDLLAAAAERVAELHLAEMAAADRAATARGRFRSRSRGPGHARRTHRRVAARRRHPAPDPLPGRLRTGA